MRSLPVLRIWQLITLSLILPTGFARATELKLLACPVPAALDEAPPKAAARETGLLLSGAGALSTSVSIFIRSNEEMALRRNETLKNSMRAVLAVDDTIRATEGRLQRLLADRQNLLSDYGAKERYFELAQKAKKTGQPIDATEVFKGTHATNSVMTRFNASLIEEASLRAELYDRPIVNQVNHRTHRPAVLTNQVRSPLNLRRDEALSNLRKANRIEYVDRHGAVFKNSQISQVHRARYETILNELDTANFKLQARAAAATQSLKRIARGGGVFLIAGGAILYALDAVAGSEPLSSEEVNRLLIANIRCTMNYLDHHEAVVAEPINLGQSQ